MRTVLFITVVLAAAVHASCAPTDTRCQFAEFKAKYGKVYTSDEEPKRYQIFVEKLAHIARLNAEQPLAHFAVNKFSDLTKEEFKGFYARLGPQFRRFSSPRADDDNSTHLRATRSLPSTFTSPYMTSVKNQASCGSCWAFTTAAVSEAAWLKANGETIDVSEQQLVDCDTSDSGCNGGNYETGLDYYIKTGFELETSYAYTSGTTKTAGTCAYSSSKIYGKVASRTCIDWDESDSGTIATALYTYGPLAVALDSTTVSDYSSGILANSGCSSAVDHAVTLAGWGVDSSSSTKYWLIKNSWGSDWGESGYFRLIRGSSACLITEWQACYAVVTSTGSTTPVVADSSTTATIVSSEVTPVAVVSSDTTGAASSTGTSTTTCGSNQCGTIENGAGGVSVCGSQCSTGSTCLSNFTCQATAGSSLWSQFLPSGSSSDFTVTTSSSVDSIVASTTTTTEKFLKWTPSSQWVNHYYTSFSVSTYAGASGVVGLGITKSKGSSDGVWWKITIPSSYTSGTSATASVALCLTVSATDHCMSYGTVTYTMASYVNLTANYILNSGVVGARLYIAGTSVTGTSYIAVTAATYMSGTGEAFVVASGASKKFTSPALYTRTKMGFALDTCMSSFLGTFTKTVGIASGAVAVSTKSYSSSCSYFGIYCDLFNFTIQDTVKSTAGTVSVTNNQYSMSLYTRAVAHAASDAYGRVYSSSSSASFTVSSTSLYEQDITGTAISFSEDTITSSATSATCSLSTSLPSGASTMGTCSSSVSADSSCAYTCSTGYTAITGICSTAGLWTVQPSCSVNPCTWSTISSGAADLGNCSSVPSGSQCSLTCNTGYSAVLGKCASGSWTTSPSCSANPCSFTLPDSAASAGTCTSSVSSGSTCTPTCNSGYTAVTGSCVTGSWNPSPSCTANACALSSLPSGASAYGSCSSSVSSGVSCALTCSSGYTAVSGTCTAGSWAASPSCSANNCSLDLPTGASSWGTCYSTVTSGTSCSLKCSSGYTTSSGSCLAGLWTSQPTCLLPGACALALPTGASDYGTCATSVSDGTTCSLTCDSGYNASSGTCSSGTWTTTPTCTGNPCTLSGLATNALGWGNCSTTVKSGITCAFGCDTDYVAVGGTCVAGSWTTSPSCRALASCSLTAPPGYLSWNDCKATMSSGSSCSFSCAAGYSAVKGTCYDGSWTTTPTCSTKGSSGNSGSSNNKVIIGAAVGGGGGALLCAGAAATAIGLKMKKKRESGVDLGSTNATGVPYA